MSNNQSPHPLCRLAIFITLFFLLWTIRAVALIPVAAQSGNPLLWALISLVLKFGLWVVPVFLYLHYIEKAKPWQYLRLGASWRKGVAWGLVIGLAQILLNLAWNYAFGPGRLHFEAIGINSVNGILLVGLTEEPLFRGLVLQKLAEYWGFWKANLVTAILFLLIHFPGWLMMGSLKDAILPLSVLALGFLFGVVLRYSNSLWACIIVHSVNNFTAAVMWG